MKKIAMVDLYFLTGAEGGQEQLVKDNFSTPIVFRHDPEQKHGLWSAVVEMIKLPNTYRTARAKLYFLFHDSPEAPNHLLEVGGEFELITNKKIASGKILTVNYE
ncbi:hypothetical protein PA598K_04589 [Paenibacillus sp. 598K]|uniref:hypothetical protein n=1 Tax=Paenibacillus sp. 598K TaxID=1117987 RepID=UPI000FFA0FFA|nr:hypothetical protein [Paenibacillus sp. 598K]GBF76141.1 hypothetical protein PA598K_04589 [Paenibacillus sp. 598K]